MVSILLGLHLPPFLGYLGATERKRSYLEVGPKKENGSTVTNPQARLNADHSFHSCAQAVNGLRQYLRKIRAICRDNAATVRKTEADTVPLCELLAK